MDENCPALDENWGHNAVGNYSLTLFRYSILTDLSAEYSRDISLIQKPKFKSYCLLRCDYVVPTFLMLIEHAKYFHLVMKVFLKTFVSFFLAVELSVCFFQVIRKTLLLSSCCIEDKVVSKKILQWFY